MAALKENTFRPTYADLVDKYETSPKSIWAPYHCMTCHKTYQVEVAFVDPLAYPEDPPCPHCAEAAKGA